MRDADYGIPISTEPRPRWSSDTRAEMDVGEMNDGNRHRQQKNPLPLFPAPNPLPTEMAPAGIAHTAQQYIS